MTIRNMFGTPRRFVVARHVDGEWWYWGSWEDRDRANAVAEDIGGSVFDMEGE